MHRSVRDGNRLARCRRIFLGVFPSDGMGKGTRLLTAGREWDGKARSRLVDGTGPESTIYWRDGTGRDHGTGREKVRKSVGNIVGKSLGSIVGKSAGNSPEIDRERSRENGREHSREIGRQRSQDMAGRCCPEWLGARSRTNAGWRQRLKRGKR